MTRTIMTPQNNNKVNFFEKKIRGSNCSRVHRIKISSSLSTSPYEKIPNNGNNNSLAKNCFSCNDSGSSMKLITERLARIEELVNNLYKITQGLQNSKKNFNPPKQKNRMLQNIDLSSCKLDDLQKLVIFTTNAMSVPSSQKSSSPKFIHGNHHEEKFQLEKNPTKEIIKTEQQDDNLKCVRQDSGYKSDLEYPSSPATKKVNDTSKYTSKNEKNENHVPAGCAQDNQDCS